ncbi:hypothetical protein Hypma_003252 [Hypsizygus marmoreus]|uniref:Uncharacterized protein n=1 Tax=Hypsizygus marmoreus TaxID=39966 RepID=A0A369K2F9_HYPMA|nr:hypothetical protein Hypma_003252 [Hypsizygus marmoreus]
MRFSSLFAFVALVTGPIALAHSYDHIYERDLSVDDISAIQAREILNVLYDFVERRSLANDEFVDLAVRAPNHLGVPVVPSPGPNIQDSKTKLPKKRSRRDISFEDREDLVTRAPNQLGVPVIWYFRGPRRDISFEDLEDLVTRAPNQLGVPVVSSPGPNIQDSKTKRSFPRKGYND